MNFFDLKKLREDRLRPPSIDHSAQANRTIEMRQEEYIELKNQER